MLLLLLVLKPHGSGVNEAYDTGTRVESAWHELNQSAINHIICSVVPRMAK